MCAVIIPSCSKESRVCTYLTTLCILTAAVVSTLAHSYFGGPKTAASLADGRNQEKFFSVFLKSSTGREETARTASAIIDKLVVVGCIIYQIRLLLNSRSSRLPKSIANSFWTFTPAKKKREEKQMCVLKRHIRKEVRAIDVMDSSACDYSFYVDTLETETEYS